MRTERQDNLGDAAGGDDGSFLSEFFLDAIQHTVDHRGIAKYDAASHAVYGIFAIDTARRIEADARQLGSAGAHAPRRRRGTARRGRGFGGAAGRGRTGGPHL